MNDLKRQVEAIEASERECVCGATIYWDINYGGYWAHLTDAAGCVMPKPKAEG